MLLHRLMGDSIVMQMKNGVWEQSLVHMTWRQLPCIGHLLGLGHSEVEGAIMWPAIHSAVTQGLHRDDINGIKGLYNFQVFKDLQYAIISM